MYMSVKASELRPGDSVFPEKGGLRTVEEVCPGPIRGTLVISFWGGGFSCEYPETILEVERREQ